MNYLALDYFACDSIDVARSLLGKTLIRKLGNESMRCRIVETEAYRGENDPASHAARGQTKRNSVMFGPPGHAYVYFNYGMHHLLNVVTEAVGVAGAVLIRALEPLDSLGLMRHNRGIDDIHQLTNGPAKLTQALAINMDFNGKALNTPILGLLDDGDTDFHVSSSERVGISAGQEKKWRFFIKGNQFVSGQYIKEKP